MHSTRRYLSFAVSLATAAALVGCTSSGEDTQQTTYVTHTVANPDAEESLGSDEPAEADTDAVIEAYSEVLDNPDRYSFTSAADYTLNGEYKYALVEMTGSGSPELLLQAMTAEHINMVRIFSITDDGTLVAPEDNLVSGAAGAGGYRAAVHASADGDRIFQAEWRSINPEISVRDFALQGDGLVSTGAEWKDDQQTPSGDLINIDFHPISDRRPLEAMQETTGSGDIDNADAPEPAPAPAPAPENGNTVTGTVRVFTAPELAQFQGLDRTPNGEDATHRFAMFVFDSPALFTAQASGGPGAPQKREAKMVRLGSQTPYTSDPGGFDLEGQSLTLSFDPNSCWFPSDASLPIGQPNCSSFTQ